LVSAPDAVWAGERLWTVREVAARLGVCTSTIYKLCAQGRLAHVRVANAIRVPPIEVERLGGERSSP
jgi:excisionase family DNA binding protein